MDRAQDKESIWFCLPADRWAAYTVTWTSGLNVNWTRFWFKAPSRTSDSCWGDRRRRKSWEEGQQQTTHVSSIFASVLPDITDSWSISAANRPIYQTGGEYSTEHQLPLKVRGCSNTHGGVVKKKKKTTQELRSEIKTKTHSSSTMLSFSWRCEGGRASGEGGVKPWTVLRFMFTDTERQPFTPH